MGKFKEYSMNLEECYGMALNEINAELKERTEEMSREGQQIDAA